jgi:hypothetical protein
MQLHPAWFVGLVERLSSLGGSIAILAFGRGCFALSPCGHGFRIEEVSLLSQQEAKG